jgi:uncharacterized protein involved in response to NO
MTAKNSLTTWATFSAAPHRMFFLAGAVQLVLVMAWWLVDLGGRYGNFHAPIEWSVVPTDAHAFLMLFGVFPFFMFGFLMTVYPRWMNGELVERRLYVPAFLLMAAGMLAFYPGLLWKGALVLSALLYLAGWAVGLGALLRVYFRAQHPDKRHARITGTMLTVGGLMSAGWYVGELAGWDFPVTLAKSAGIWLFLFPIFFAVSHRMIPFFSANVIRDYVVVRPNWALAVMPPAGLAHLLLELNGAATWLWIPDLAMAGTALYLTWAWRLRASFAQPILAMLHVAFAWLGIAFLLFALQSLALLGGVAILGKAPLHALTIGYFGGMVFAMITRVTLGHSGRMLVVENAVWWVFLLFQFTALLRIAGDLPGVPFVARSYLYLAAAALWLACFVFWNWRYLPIYWRPREDGQPG